MITTYSTHLTTGGRFATMLLSLIIIILTLWHPPHYLYGFHQHPWIMVILLLTVGILFGWSITTGLNFIIKENPFLIDSLLNVLFLILTVFSFIIALYVLLKGDNSGRNNAYLMLIGTAVCLALQILVFLSSGGAIFYGSRSTTTTGGTRVITTTTRTY